MRVPRVKVAGYYYYVVWLELWKAIWRPGLRAVLLLRFEENCIYYLST